MKLEYPARALVMMKPLPNRSSFASAYSVRAQRAPLLFSRYAPRRGRAPPARRPRCGGTIVIRSHGAGESNRRGRFGEDARADRPGGAYSAITASRSFSAPTLSSTSGSRHRAGGVSRAPAPNWTVARKAHNCRPRLPRPIRFARRISTRQRGRTGDGQSARSLRDFFGHTASISRRRTS